MSPTGALIAVVHAHGQRSTHGQRSILEFWDPVDGCMVVSTVIHGQLLSLTWITDGISGRNGGHCDGKVRVMYLYRFVVMMLYGWVMSMQMGGIGMMCIFLVLHTYWYLSCTQKHMGYTRGSHTWVTQFAMHCMKTQGNAQGNAQGEAQGNAQGKAQRHHRALWLGLCCVYKRD